MIDHWHIALATAEGWEQTNIIHRGIQEECTVCADVREVGSRTAVNQDSDSPRREPTVELMTRRRDAWRQRYEALLDEAKALREKIRRLERDAKIAAEQRENLETLRANHRLIHQYWTEARVRVIERDATIQHLTEDRARLRSNFGVAIKDLQHTRAVAAERETTIQRLLEENERLRGDRPERPEW